MTKELPSIEMLRKLLRYEASTGKLFWEKRAVNLFNDGKQPVEMTCFHWNRTWAGKEAFTANDGNGYKQGRIFGKSYRAHRIIWAIAYGYWPDEVDHINGVRSDNRICNLRDVDRTSNCRNLSVRSNNTSGVVGVSWDKTYKKWHSRIRDVHIGYYDEFDDAVEARRAAELKYGFHPNHGRLS